MYPVITISREFGSGGHSIGEKVAKKLNIPFLDQEIVNQVAEESGYAREMVEEQGEHASAANKWFDVSAASAMYFQSPQDEIFIIQKKVILEAAAKGPCVIVGRCADYLLRKADMKCLNVMIHADMAGALRRSEGCRHRKTHPEERQTAQDLLSLLHRSGVGQLPQL